MELREIINNSHLLDQKKFHEFFHNFLKRTNIQKTEFIDPPQKGDTKDLKNSHINNYLNKMKNGEASDGNCATVIEHIFARYKEMEHRVEKENKLRIEMIETFIKKEVSVDEKAKIKSFDDLWNSLAADPGELLKSRINWKDYENDLKQNLIKISGQDWNFFEKQNVNIKRHIHRIMFSDHKGINNDKIIENVANLADEIDSLVKSEQAKEPYKGAGSMLLGKYRANKYFNNLKKIDIFFTTSFLAPIYQQLPKTRILQIIVPVIYRIFFSGSKQTKFKVDDSKLKRVNPENRDAFLRRFLFDQNLLIKKISENKI